MVSAESCHSLWNSDTTDVIKLSRGLRQGSLLSPYLFILCSERLGKWLQRKVAEGRMREVRASINGPGLSHLFFADDLLLFSEACEDRLTCIREGLELFRNYSDQRISFKKLSMFGSPIVSNKVAS